MNNILSTESVSPKAFYECRGYGSKRWSTIPENGSDFAITLYDYPAAFERPQAEMEDHPLLVEFYSDEEFPRVGEGVHACNHTLYFNPANVRFIFFGEKDKRVSLSLTEGRLETKLVGIYKSRMCVESFDRHYEPMPMLPFDKVNMQAVEWDRRINRMKGLLYGYYVGAYLTATPEQVQKIGACLEIQNIFASIISGSSHIPTEYQRARLNELFAILCWQDPLFKELVEFEGSTDRAEALLSLLRKHGKNVAAIDAEQFIDSLRRDQSGNCIGIRWVKESIAATQAEMMRSCQWLSPEAEEIVVVDGKLQKVTSGLLSTKEMQKLFSAWTNDVLTRDEFSGKISACKDNLVTALTLKAKETLGDAWVEGNSTRNFLNALRKHIIGKNPFEEAWSNNLLSAVAAVLSKGDEWEDLLRFMQGKGLTDYRLAFAMYGELNGFANLTRDFTDMVLCGRNSYRRAMYQEFHGQLLGQEINWSNLDRPAAGNDTLTSVSSKTGGNEISSDQAGKKPSVVENLKTRVMRFFDGDGFKCRKSAAERQSLRTILINVFEKLTANPAPDVFISELASRKDGWSATKQPWKIMQKEFAPDYTPTRKRAKRKVASDQCFPEMRAEFENASCPGSILSYQEWIQDCASLITSEKAAQCFMRDVKYFVDHWEINPDLRFASSVVDKSNGAVLKRFAEYLDRQRHTTNPKQIDWKPALYAEIPVDIIIQKLRTRYGC